MMHLILSKMLEIKEGEYMYIVCKVCPEALP